MTGRTTLGIGGLDASTGDAVLNTANSIGVMNDALGASGVTVRSKRGLAIARLAATGGSVGRANDVDAGTGKASSVATDRLGGANGVDVDDSGCLAVVSASVGSTGGLDLRDGRHFCGGAETRRGTSNGLFAGCGTGAGRGRFATNSILDVSDD